MVLVLFLFVYKLVEVQRNIKGFRGILDEFTFSRYQYKTFDCSTLCVHLNEIEMRLIWKITERSRISPLFSLLDDISVIEHYCRASRLSSESNCDPFLI